ncbi:type II toxin-antitoxin system YhaV family toxin [Legionella gresilensis]|uniref:type II toxin-antitoxin system YhaV family toxin n=1 Tax=Legionella gresilensis TaxID=91823 RepID=UPI0010417FE8|nr:type II toxin-antitoxin system YhaV family toxin [Legionella gresilensis]
MIEPLIINGWIILVHPIFMEQINSLIKDVEKIKEKEPSTFHLKNKAKLLAAIAELAFKKIPTDPSASIYRLGETLGNQNKHWFRAKFFQQYRLFFRFSLEKKIIIYAWVNDENTKRAYNKKTDAYSVFERMLKKGKPPNNWDDLLKEAYNDKCIEKIFSILN